MQKCSGEKLLRQNLHPKLFDFQIIQHEEKLTNKKKLYGMLFSFQRTFVLESSLAASITGMCNESTHWDWISICECARAVVRKLLFGYKTLWSLMKRTYYPLVLTWLHGKDETVVRLTVQYFHNILSYKANMPQGAVHHLIYFILMP